MTDGPDTSTDLTERLRRVADAVGNTFGDDDPPEGDLSLGDLAYFVMHEAADEIDRLKAQVST